MNSPSTELCGYTVPHPMENKIHLRIQSKDIPAIDILRKALQELKQQNLEVLEMIKVS